MFPKDLLELLQDAGLPKDVAHYCVMPYVYPNTNKQRKRIMQTRKALMTQMHFVKNAWKRRKFYLNIDQILISADVMYKNSKLATISKDCPRRLRDLFEDSAKRARQIINDSASPATRKFLKRIGAINPYL